MTDFTAVMAEVKDANEQHGIDFRGKSYLEVAKRVEIFRKHYGMSAGISTEVLHLGMTRGEPVAIRAEISFEGRIVATGTASEVIGEGNVNRASALENAETSAIGRALATLGLHGGEFASLNEMSAIGIKPENATSEALKDAWEDGIMDGLSTDPSERAVAEAYCEQIGLDVVSYKQEKWLDAYMKKHRTHIEFIENHAPELHEALKEQVLDHRAKLKKAV